MYTYINMFHTMSTTVKMREGILVPLAPKVKEGLRRRADSDGMPMSKVLSIFAEKYAAGEIGISFSVTSFESEVEIIPVSGAVAEKMSRVESLL
jgi:hypothetical protein